MKLAATKTQLENIQPLRALFLQKTNFQVRYNARHERGLSDSYSLSIDDLMVGYGSVMGQDLADRDTVFEYFVVQPFRSKASQLFQQLLVASGARFVECQSNDLLLSSMLYEFCRSATADVILFQDHTRTEHTVPSVNVRARRDDDRVFEHKAEPVGDYVAELGGEIVGTGGFLLHYNKPFADLYMEVREDRRRQGIGSFLLQEVKMQCYLAGRVPAARCDLRNTASRATLLKAGFRVCGFMLRGEISPSTNAPGN